MDSLARLFTRGTLQRRAKRTSAQVQSANRVKNFAKMKLRLQREITRREQRQIRQSTRYQRLLKKQSRDARKRAWCQSVMRTCANV
jgi:hypothetical protein